MLCASARTIPFGLRILPKGKLMQRTLRWLLYRVLQALKVAQSLNKADISIDLARAGTGEISQLFAMPLEEGRHGGDGFSQLAATRHVQPRLRQPSPP
jgi:hypothetical protein